MQHRQAAFLFPVALMLLTQGALAGAKAPTAQPQPAPAGWVDQVRQGLEAREYDLTWQNPPATMEIGPAWQAPNRAQGFRTYFVADGIRVVPRSESDVAWRWGLSLAGYGRGDKTGDVPRATLVPSGRRIEYRRGALQEIYENTEKGLEQRYILPGPPANASQDEEDSGSEAIHLDLELWGDLSARISEDRLAIDFVTASGAPALHYAGLKVTDAGGRTLAAWMEGFAVDGKRGIRLMIDARHATYPIDVDPLTTGAVWMTFGGQASARYGEVVATAGDVNGDGYSDVLVGAPFYDNGQTDEGRAYLYLGSAAGLSTIPAWTAEANQNGAQFGLSVATAGDVNGDGFADVIVGAHQVFAPLGGEGRVYVYFGSSAGLPASPSWTATGSQVFTFLGYSVSTAGDVNNDGYSDIVVSGLGRAVYLYFGSASGPAATPVSTVLPEAGGTSEFGVRVATAGDVNGDGFADVLVGDDFYTNGESIEGRVHLYLGSAAGIAAPAAWTVESNNANAHLGFALGTAGDVNGDGYADVITGAYGYTVGGQAALGQAAVYLGSASGLATTPAWTVLGGQANTYVGVSVGTAGDINGDGYADVIVGAYGYTNGQTNEGRALLYLGSATGLQTTAAWTAESNSANSLFGAWVATAGDVNGDGYADVLVGAPYYDGPTDQGAAFLYLGSAAGPRVVYNWGVEGNQADELFGWSSASAGDVNGDGYADLIVGAPDYDAGQTNEGRASVFLGGASGLATTPAWTAEGNLDGIEFGVSVASAGDVNGDGYSDVIVGASGFGPNSSTPIGPGYAYVFLGSASGLAAGPIWTATGDQDGSQLGTSVASAGDVNGDGYADVVVGAPNATNGQTNEGRAWLYLGSPAGPGVAPAWTAESDSAGALFGFSVASAGDVNRDGYSDVLIGAYGYSNGMGRAYLYLGSPAGPAAAPIWTQDGSIGGDDLFGWSVATAGDVNGDGYSDIIIGAPFYLSGAGAAFVYHGSASGIPVLSWTKIGEQFGDILGAPVGTAGDVNGDGYADVVVCANEVTAYVYLGSATGLATTAVWQSIGGDALTTAGDVNGDGYADIVSSLGFFGGTVNGGTASVYYGNAGTGGLSLNARQRRPGGGPIAPGGRSNAPGSFALDVLARTPFGRSGVRLEWELKPVGTPFTGSTVLTTEETADTGTAGVSLSGLAAGLNPGAYHWRLRLRYDPAKTPFAQKSRWVTIPWHGWQEAHLTLGAFLGGWVWDDLDRDGVRENGEPVRGGVTVSLLSASGAVLDQRTTLADGSYSFALPGAASSFRLRFLTLNGAFLSPQDQGGDDTLDSDPDPTTGLTPLVGPVFTFVDNFFWSAGLTCNSPTQPALITGARTVGGTASLILDFTDPNPASQLTGYNVYRANQPQPPPAPWTLLGSNVVDGDPVTAGIQWTDTTGVNPAAGAAFYYQVVPYNAVCQIEGPR